MTNYRLVLYILIILLGSIISLIACGTNESSLNRHPSKSSPIVPKIQVERDSNNELLITWPSSDSAEKYFVYRSSDENFLSEKTTIIETTDTKYPITEQLDPELIYFRITAVWEDIESLASNELQINVLPPPPKRLKVVLSGNRNIVQWSGSNDSYTVYWFSDKIPSKDKYVGKHSNILGQTYLHELQFIADLSELYYTVVSVREGIESKYFLNPDGSLISNAIDVETEADNSNTDSKEGRISEGLAVLYIFDGSSKSVIRDRSGLLPPIDLEISGNVVRTETGLLFNITNQIQAPNGIAFSSNNTSERLNNAIIQSGGFTAEAWLEPSSNAENGMGRIVTLSDHGGRRNFSLLQSDDWYVRVRGEITGLNGTIAGASFSGSVRDTLKLGEKTHVVYSHAKDGYYTLYVNGQEIGRNYMGKISKWNENYPLALGNEISDARPWQGEMQLVAIYDRALTKDEVTQNYNASSEVIFEEQPFVWLQNNDGMISIEAENYNKKTEGSRNHYWDDVTKAAVSGIAMEAFPEDDFRLPWEEDLVSISPKMSYEIEFTQTGTYYIWVRGWAPSGSSDSIHIGLNNEVLLSSSNLNNFGINHWQWSNQNNMDPRTIEVDNTGVHTLHVLMRESGVAIDKVVITKDLDYIPSDLGPKESQRLQ